jgi:hypothetical protein
VKNLLPFILLFALYLFISCKEEVPIFDSRNLINDWVCVSLQEGEEEQPFMSGSIRFSFRADSTYDYQGGIYHETGRWKLKRDLLITKAENNLEKQVRILYLSADTLNIMMNDRGFEMKMLLVSE